MGFGAGRSERKEERGVGPEFSDDWKDIRIRGDLGRRTFTVVTIDIVTYEHGPRFARSDRVSPVLVCSGPARALPSPAPHLIFLTDDCDEMFGCFRCREGEGCLGPDGHGRLARGAGGKSGSFIRALGSAETQGPGRFEVVGGRVEDRRSKVNLRSSLVTVL